MISHMVKAVPDAESGFVAVMRRTVRGQLVVQSASWFRRPGACLSVPIFD